MGSAMPPPLPYLRLLEVEYLCHVTQRAQRGGIQIVAYADDGPHQGPKLLPRAALPAAAAAGGASDAPARAPSACTLGATATAFLLFLVAV